jgi:hypothetical protein
MSWSELRDPRTVRTEAERSLSNPGRIYAFDDLVFINEKNQGIHVIDIRDHGAPTPIAFINIPGNLDMGVLQTGGTTYLYADSFVDLVTLEIDQNPDAFSATFVSRRTGVFPYNPLQAVAKEEIPVWFDGYNEDKGVIVGYETRVESGWSWLGPVFYEDGSTTGEGRAGKAGSMARFCLYQDSAAAGDGWYLYSVSDSSLAVFHLADPREPLRQARVDLGWGIETIFPRGGHLFIGSVAAMYVFAVDQPSNPVQVSEFQHWTSYDPVVVGSVQGAETAFVTLRSDQGWGVDSLIAVDVQDVRTPSRLVEISLWNPHGLGFFEHNGNERLIVADGSAGLKVFDVSSVRNPSLPDGSRLRQILAVQNGFGTFDLIPLGATILVVGPDGLFLYQYAENVDPSTGESVGRLVLEGRTPG